MAITRFMASFQPTKATHSRWHIVCIYLLSYCIISVSGNSTRYTQFINLMVKDFHAITKEAYQKISSYLLSKE